MKNILIKNILLIEEDILPLAEVKLFLRVVSEGDDELIKSNILAATEFAEQYLGRYVHKRKITCVYKPSPLGEVILPASDIIAIEEVKLKDDDEIILEDGKDFILSHKKITFSPHFRNKDIEIRFIAGFARLPEAIKQGIFFHTSMLYDKEIMDHEKRESLCLLYKPYRNLRIF